MSVTKNIRKAKAKIKAFCTMLVIFKESDSFDWCYGCLLHSMVSKTWRVSRCFKGYCNSPAYVRVCVCMSKRSPLCVSPFVHLPVTVVGEFVVAGKGD